MEFPYGHTHNRRDEDDGQYPPPAHTHHHRHQNDFPPPPPEDYRDQPSYPPPDNRYGGYGGGGSSEFGYPNPPPPQQPDFGYPQSGYPSSHHVSHEINDYPQSEYPSSHHVSHEINRPSYEGGFDPELLNRPTFRVFCKEERNCSLTVRNGKVMLAPSNPNDAFQQWIKDERFCVKVKDEEGFPSFALINKGTGEALKHAVAAHHPVQLQRYDSNEFDESFLWSESNDVGDGYKAIRMVNNIRLNMDAFHVDKQPVGSIIGLWEWTKKDNQRWKIVRN